MKFTYGTHIPINKGIIKTFGVSNVLELGSGLYSTKMFFDNVEYVTAIETDKCWFDKLNNELHLTDKHELIHHEVNKSDVENQNIDVENIKKYINFYKQNNNNYQLLFVDHIIGMRVPVLNQMHDMFDFIVYHDAEAHIKGYNYKNFIPSDEYMYFVDETYPVKTAFLIHKKYKDKIEELIKNIESEIIIYNGPVPYKPKIIEYTPDRWKY